MFNKFYNYITGLINNRFVYQEVKDPEPIKSEEAKNLEETVDKINTVEDINKFEREYFDNLKAEGKEVTKAQKQRTMESVRNILKGLGDTPDKKKKS